MLANKATYGRYWPSLQAQAQGLPTTVTRSTEWCGTSAPGSACPGPCTTAVRPRHPREGDANIASIAAQIDSIRLQVRVGVEQARLAVVGAKASLAVADRSLTNARARLDLAEVRYRTGVGSIIELSDAQLAATNAAFQKLQAQLQLDTARAQLTRSLAR